MAGYAVEYGSVGNEGNNVNVSRANGQGGGHASGELIGRAEGKSIVPSRSLRDDQHIGCAVNRISWGA